MKKLITILAVIFLTLGTCAANPPQKNANGEDSEVAATYFTVVDLILTGQFAELDTMIDTIARTQEMTVDGVRRLEELYTKLLIMDPALLDKWAEGSPKSAHPFVVRGKYQLQQASQRLREAGITTFVEPADQVKLSLRKAQADFETAVGLDQTNPAAPAELVAVAMYRGYPAHIMEQWFQKSMEADPAWLAAYRHKLHYLSPTQQGSEQAMLEFAMACAQEESRGGRAYSLLFDYFEFLNDGFIQVSDPGNLELHLPADAGSALLAVVQKFKAEFPYTYVPHYYEARYLALTGEPQAAEYILSTILKTEPENQKVLSTRINLYMARGEWLKAKEDCQALLALAPDSPLALADLGAIATLLDDDQEKMEELYATAISKEPSPLLRKRMYLDLGNLLAEKAAFAKAIQAYDNALEIDENFEPATLAKARCQAKQAGTKQ